MSRSYAQRLAAGRVDPDRLRRLYLDEQSTVDDIADELGLSRSAVYAALHEHGIGLRGTPGRRDRSRQLTRANLARWLGEGRSITWIADRTGADHTTVAEWIARHGLATPPEDAEQLRRWYVEEGRTLAEVAELAGIGVRTARRRLLAAGVQLRPRGRRAEGGPGA